MKKVTIYPKEQVNLDDPLRKRFGEAVRRLNIPKSRFLRNALTSYLDYLEGREKK